MNLRVVVVGATGLIGRPLCHTLIRTGHEVVVFSRDPARARHGIAGATACVSWQPDRLSDECRDHLRAADAVIYLAGAPLFDGRRHTRGDVETEGHTRIHARELLVAAMADLDRRPNVLIAASSVGYYGYGRRNDTAVDESHPPGDDWWGRDSAAIEKAAFGARGHAMRTVALRTGYVLTRDSLADQTAQFRRHTGGWIGTGRGWILWIHIADATGIIAFALDRPDLDGPINLTAPEPARSREFARALGHTLGRRAWLPAPSPLVRLGLGVVTDILVRGRRVLPSVAGTSGYRFHFPDLGSALHDLLSREPDNGEGPR